MAGHHQTAFDSYKTLADSLRPGLAFRLASQCAEQTDAIIDAGEALNAALHDARTAPVRVARATGGAKLVGRRNVLKSLPTG
jgi:hypothetical protein